MSDSFNDKFLIAGSLAGDDQAFGKLYDKYIDEIYRFILMRVRSKEEAQDLTNEVFLKIWQYINNNDTDIDNVRAFLYRIARNIVIDKYRKSGKELLALDEDMIESIPDESLDLEDEVQKKDELNEVLGVVDKLPEDQRELILMKYVQDLSVKEIAQVLEKSRGAVRVSLHRAIKKLKTLL
jgi:RNA polymerase sigma-70 factor, ECF subfamily